jgi:hypothetical protein
MDCEGKFDSKYRKWRTAVFVRDDFICQCCGSGKRLNAHHIENFYSNIKLRYDVCNGVTLCEACHLLGYENSFHNIYGTHNNNKDQLVEYFSYRGASLKIE